MSTCLPYFRRIPAIKRFNAEGLQRVILVIAFFCGSAHANTITVNNGSSGSVAAACTLQDAVAAANTNAAVNACAAGTAGADTIVFAPGISGGIATLTTTSLSVSIHAITARYAGDSTYAAAISNTFGQTINAAPVVPVSAPALSA